MMMVPKDMCMWTGNGNSYLGRDTRGRGVGMELPWLCLIKSPCLALFCFLDVMDV